MKKFKIAINISLVVKLLIWVGLAILLFYLGMDEAGKAAKDTAESAGQSSAVGGAIGGAFAGLAVAMMVVLGVFCFAIPVLFTIIIIIRYNVGHKVTLALGIITIITSCITAGVLMLVQRSKMINSPEEK